MADFSDPRYASYVQLCRELTLPRQFEVGDRCWWEPPDRDRALGARGGIEMHYGDLDRDDAHSADDRHFWLPSLADWLEKLEDVGVRHVEFDPGIDDFHCISVDVGEIGTADTREEAEARLWLAVTGHRGSST